MVVSLAMSQNVRMAKKTKHPGHFIREWRKHQGITLERLADRVGTTHATLSRIERGKVPYSQVLLEALAEAFGTTTASLITRDPSAPNPIWELWEQIPIQDRERAAKVLEAFKKAG